MNEITLPLWFKHSKNTTPATKGMKATVLSNCWIQDEVIS